MVKEPLSFIKRTFIAVFPIEKFIKRRICNLMLLSFCVCHAVERTEPQPQSDFTLLHKVLTVAQPRTYLRWLRNKNQQINRNNVLIEYISILYTYRRLYSSHVACDSYCTYGTRIILTQYIQRAFRVVSLHIQYIHCNCHSRQECLQSIQLVKFLTHSHVQ